SRIDRYAQSAESMLVGRRYLNESRIERKDLFTKQRRHFAQENGYIVGLSARHQFPNIRSDEESVCAKTFRILRRRIRSLALGVQMNYFDLAQLRRSCGQGSNELLRGGGYAMNKDSVFGFNDGDGLFGIYYLHLSLQSLFAAVNTAKTFNGFR